MYTYIKLFRHFYVFIDIYYSWKKSSYIHRYIYIYKCRYLYIHDNAVTNADLPSSYNRCRRWSPVRIRPCSDEYWLALLLQSLPRWVMMPIWTRQCSSHVSKISIHKTCTMHMCICTCAYAQCTLNSSKKGPARRGFCTKGFLHEGLSDASEVVVRRHSSKAFVAIGFALAWNRRLKADSGPQKEIPELGGFFLRDFEVFLISFCFWQISGWAESLLRTT